MPRIVSGFARTFWEKWELFVISKNCFRLPRTVCDFQELFETSKKYLTLLRTAWEFQELFEASENCFRLPRKVWKFRELCETSEKFLRLRELWSSLVYNTSARHERHECNTSATRVLHKRYGCDTSEKFWFW